MPQPREAPAFRLRYVATPTVPHTTSTTSALAIARDSRRITRKPTQPSAIHPTAAATRHGDVLIPAPHDIAACQSMYWNTFASCSQTGAERGNNGATSYW